MGKVVISGIVFKDVVTYDTIISIMAVPWNGK